MALEGHGAQLRIKFGRTNELSQDVTVFWSPRRLGLPSDLALDLTNGFGLVAHQGGKEFEVWELGTTAPVQRGSVGSTAQFTGVDVNSTAGLAYVAGRGTTVNQDPPFLIIDYKTDPDNPTVEGVVGWTSGELEDAFSVVADPDRNRAYVSNAAGLTSVDVSASTAPAIAGVLSGNHRRTNQIALDSTSALVYTGRNTAGLLAADVSSTGAPTSAGETTDNTITDVDSVVSASSRNLVFLTCDSSNFGQGRVVSVDVSQSTGMTVQDFLDIGSEANKSSLDNSRDIYYVTESSNLLSVDVATSTNLQEFDNLPTSEAPSTQFSDAVPTTDVSRLAVSLTDSTGGRGLGYYSSTFFTYKTVGELTDLQGPSEKLEMVQITHHESSGKAEYIPGAYDGGKVNATVNLDPNDETHIGSSGIRGLLRSATPSTFRIKWPSTGTDVDDFGALVTAWQPDATHDEVLSGTLTLKLDGQPSASTST